MLELCGDGSFMDVNNNFFFFKSTSYGDTKHILYTGPCIFDWNLLILDTILGQKHLLELDLHIVPFL